VPERHARRTPDIRIGCCFERRFSVATGHVRRQRGGLLRTGQDHGRAEDLCKLRFVDDTAVLTTEADALLALEDDALRPMDDAGPIGKISSYTDVGYQIETPS